MSTAVGSCQSKVVVSIKTLKAVLVECNQNCKWLYLTCAAAVAGPSAGEDEDALPTYKEAFPPLPERAATPDGTQETASAWTSKIRPLKSSVITQVSYNVNSFAA